MFCGNCGSKIEDGAKFCPSCGSAVAAEPAAEAPVIETPAPVQEAPVVETPAPAPIPEAPAASVQETPVQTGTPYQQQAYTQPVPLIQPAGPVQAPQKKKKGKAGLIAGLTAGAVVIGGGAVGYFGFHDDITRLFMGNAEYARMIDKKSYEGLKVDDTNAEKLTGYFTKTFDETLYALKTTRDQSDSMAADYAADSDTDIGADYNSDSSSQFTNQLLGAARALGSSFDTLPEGTAMYVDSNVKVELGSVFAMLDNETTRAVLDTINSITVKEKLANGETDLMSVGIDDGKGHTGSADIYLNDGSILITFPGISDKKIYISKETIESAAGTAQTERKALDPDELKRIREEIVNIYYEAYDTAEITFTDNTEWTETVTGGTGDITASAKGNQMRVYFTAEQLKDMMDKVTELIKNDEYLIGYVKDTFGVSESDYKKAFEGGKDKADELKFDLAVDHIVDVHNNVLASMISVLPKEEKMIRPSLTFIEDKEASVVHINIYNDDSSGNIDILAGDKKTSDTDGSAVFRILYDKEDIDLSFECLYTGREKKQFLGKDLTVGKYTVKLADPDKFIESAKKLVDLVSGSRLPDLDSIIDGDIITNTAVSGAQNPFGDNKAILEELKKVTFTFENALDGDVYTTSTEISLGDIGSLAFSSRAEKKDETVTMPDTAGAITADDSEALSGLTLDAMKWAKDIAASIDGGEGELSKSIASYIDSYEKEARFKAHYSQYNSYSTYTASSAASDIYYDVADAINASDVQEGVIKLFFKDGKCEIIDDAGVEGISVGDPSELDSVYAEIFINKAISSGAVGVTAVLTDDKNDLPDNLPDIFNYYDGVYPWDNGENGYIGDYVVSSSPYLMTGEVTSTELPAGALSLDDLNASALYISDAVTDLLGRGGELGQFRRTTGTEIVISYKCGKDRRWSTDGTYVDGTYTSGSAVAEELVTEILEGLNSVSEEFDNMKEITADIYFYNGKFAGTAVFNNDSYLSYGYTFGIFRGTDMSSGSFAHWAEKDGAPTAGYIDHYGDLVPVGTYSLKTGSSLSVGSSADPGGDYDGTWSVTAVRGMTIDDLAKLYQSAGMELPSLYVTVNGSTLDMSNISDESITAELEYGKEYNGLPAASIIYEGEEIGYFVFDGTIGHIYSTDGDDPIDLVWEGREPYTLSGNIKEYPEISDVVGLWRGTIGGTEQDVIIDSNAVFGAYDGVSLDSEFYLLNPTQYGFDIYEDGMDIVGNIGYYEDDNVIIVYDSFTDESVRFIRLETAPLAAYAGDWTVETIDGLSPEAYAEENDVSVDDAAINMSIGAYSALLKYSTQYELGTLYDIDGISFRVESVDDGYFDCTYSAITKKITANINSNDGDTLGVIVFKRGTAARG